MLSTGRWRVVVAAKPDDDDSDSASGAGFQSGSASVTIARPSSPHSEQMECDGRGMRRLSLLVARRRWWVKAADLPGFLPASLRAGLQSEHRLLTVQGPFESSQLWM